MPSVVMNEERLNTVRIRPLTRPIPAATSAARTSESGTSRPWL